jgi:hypothetical protein
MCVFYRGGIIYLLWLLVMSKIMTIRNTVKGRVMSLGKGWCTVFAFTSTFAQIRVCVSDHPTLVFMFIMP